jgi:membrane protease YdiL (CAAX protease family)
MTFSQKIRSLSAQTEFTAVLVLVFGISFVRNIKLLFIPLTEPAISNGHLLRLIFLESAIYLIVGWGLLQRDWSFRRIGLKPTWKETGEGFLVFVLVLVLLTIYAPLKRALGGAIDPHSLVAPGIDFGLIALASLINPIFEETFECGYIITWFSARGLPWVGVGVNCAVRMVCHLYKGLAGAIEVGVLGLIFGWWYQRNGRLWPVVVAHMLADFVSLVTISRLLTK